MDIPVRNFPHPSFNSKVDGQDVQEKKFGDSLNSNEVENKKDEKWTSKIFDGVISFSLVAIFFGVPVFFTGLALQGIIFEKQMYFYFWILVALIAWISKGVTYGEMKIRRTPLDVPIVIFWLAYLLSTIFSIDKWHSFWGFFGDPTHGFINVTASVVVYYLILSHFNEKRFRLMLGAFLTSGFVIMVWEILVVRGILKLQDQKFLEAHQWAQYLPSSLIGSTSGVSIFLGVLVIILVTAFLRTQMSALKKVKKITLMIIFLIMIIFSLYLLLAFYFFVPTLIFPFAAILIGVGFFLIYILARIIKTDNNSVWLPMIVFMIIFGFSIVGNVIVSNFKVSAVNFPTEVSPQYQLSWQVAKEAIKNNFFLGSGPATYGYNFSLYHSQDFNLESLYNIRFYQGSGALWEILPTLGALGSFAFALLGISFLSVSVYLLSRDKEKNKIYSLGMMSAMLIVFISAATVRMDGTMIILSVLLGILTLGIILKESDAKEEFLNLSLKASPKYALALAFVFLVVSSGVVFLFVFLGRVYAADILAGKSGRQQNMTEENSVGLIMKAIRLYNKESRYYTLGGQQYAVLANNEIMKGNADGGVLVGQYLNNSIKLMTSGRDLMSKDAVAVESLAQAYEKKSSYDQQSLDQTLTAYNDALVLEPNNPDIYLKLGQIKARQASVEKDESKQKILLVEAEDMFQESIDIKKNFASGYYYLSLMQNQAGDIDKAIESAKNAVSFNTKDINGLFNLASLYQKKGGEDELAASEYLYQQILIVAPNDINTHLNLGLLYEKQKKKDQALEQYQKIIDVLPNDYADARSQVQKFINNVNSGISNELKASSTTPVPTDANINNDAQSPVEPVPATSVPDSATPAASVTQSDINTKLTPSPASE